MTAAGIYPGIGDYIFDCDASANWCGRAKEKCPCLTRSRRQGLWHIGWGARLSGAVTMRLQGLSSRRYCWSGSEPDLRSLAGNSMSLCVIEPLIRNALLACGWSPDIPDRWSSGVATAELLVDAWGASVPRDLINTLPEYVARHFPAAADLASTPLAEPAASTRSPTLDAPPPLPAATRTPDPEEHGHDERSIEHPAWLHHLLSGLERVVADFSSELTNSGCFAHSQDQTPVGRQRDIFPLPLLPPAGALDSLPHCAEHSLAKLVSAVSLANVTIRALNVLAGGRTPQATIARTAPQRQSQGMVLSKALRLIARASASPQPLDGRIAWASLIDDQDELPNPAAKSKLVADRCDLLECSGLVDPTRFLDDEARSVIASADRLFPNIAEGLRHGGKISASDTGEYAKLVVRQLRSNKVALFDHVDAWASVFAVGKSSGNQREVWNGANLSSGAAPPPRPPHLANPSCFLDLEALDGDRVRVTKRDARCYFDQLRLPEHLRT